MQNSLKIDIYPHILPLKYKNALYKMTTLSSAQQARIETLPTLFDLDLRFRLMDKYEGLMQVLTLNAPPIEEVADPKTAEELARIANDEMSELVIKYPDRFVAAVACLPMNNIDAAWREVDRAVNDLKLKGVLIYTPVNNKPLDSLEFIPLYEKMHRYNLPIWIHPRRLADVPDYCTEDKSKYGINSIFGWPYETTAAMSRLVFSGIIEKYPKLKFVTHHCGGMVPYFEQRILGFDGLHELRGEKGDKPRLTKPVLDYFRMFYYDTALYGSTPGLMCAYAFCGADKMLFGTDMPHDDQLGDRCVSKTISSVEQMDISDSDKQKIFEYNACKLLGLSL
jgi:predicted TIM-barrel fold metal-dependent hydrolase